MEAQPWPRAMIDGRMRPLPEAALPLVDEGFGRGDGAFETVGVWQGRPFALDAHLERLAASLRGVLLPEVDVALLRDEIGRVLAGVSGDAALRLYVTASGTRVLTCTDPPERGDPTYLVPYVAPWIQPRAAYGPAGAKTMSYLPNMIATRAARAAGGDDALLTTAAGVVLEGPTFALYWVTGGVLHAPSIELGIIDSTSRRAVLDLASAIGLEVVTGEYVLGDVLGADEVLLSSAVRDVIAVRRLGDHRFAGTTPARDRLSKALAAARRGR